MSKAIEQITIGSQEGRLVLGNAQAAATLNIGNSWARIKVGGRVCIDDSGGNIAGSPRFFLGVMASPSAGVANGPLGATCSHYLGAGEVGSGIGLTRTAGPPVRYSGRIYAIKKITNTITNMANINGAIVSGTPGTYRKALIMELRKSGGTLKIDIYNITTWNNVDHSYANLVTAMQTDVLTTAGLNTLFGDAGAFGNATATPTIDEATNGHLNALVCGWDQVTPVARFSEVLFSVWS